MDELLNDFLVETSEHIEAAGAQLVFFERDPTNVGIINSIFRLVHTIKGTCGFLGLPRLEQLAHAAESVIGRLRDGELATPETVSLILAAVDRIKFIIAALETSSREPDGDDNDLLNALDSQIPGRLPEPTEAELAAAFLNEVVATAPARETAPVAQPDKAPAQADIRPAVQARRSETIRVAVDALERMMLLVSELVLTRNQLLELTRHQEDETVKAPLQRLSALTSDLQDAVMRARMQPVARLFSSLPRLVRELAVDLKKKLTLVTEGGDTELDRQLIELIRDPLTHILRNSADHGIEMPDVRAAAGKPETGTIQVTASHEAGYITIDVIDDGRGLDIDKIRIKAIGSGFATAAEIERMSEDEICRFILEPNFSTAAAVTNISGRGMGMDVVRENIESIGGSVSLSSTFGRGTRISLKIPLTLAIAPALIIEVGAQRFALPQHSVIEAVGLDVENTNKLERVHGSLILRLRDEVLPVADLAQFLGLPEYDGKVREDGLVVVMRVGALAFGIVVDGVIDVQEIVVKPLGASLTHLAAFSGHTILGDGSVVLILDPLGLASGLGLVRSNEYVAIHDAETYVPAEEMTRLVLFRAGPGALRAIPLSLIGRIEAVPNRAIESSEGKLVMQHHGKLMPLVKIGEFETSDPEGETPVLVMSTGGENMGLVVQEIIDILEECLQIHIAGGTPGVIGSARIRDSVVEILDVTHFMRLARPNAFARGFVKRFNILLVDDKLFFRDMLSPVLTASGYRVTTAASGEAVLALLHKGAHFDAIVTDTDMPGMSGYGLAKAILADPRYAKIPVLALAAHAAPAVVEAAAACGMYGAVGKFDRNGLIETLGHLLNSQELHTHGLEMRVIAEYAA